MCTLHIWRKETLCQLSRGTGWYLASGSCLCSGVLRHPPPPCHSTARQMHEQLAKYHPVPSLRSHNVSWHQVFCLPEEDPLGIQESIANPEIQLLIIFREKGEARTPPVGQGFRTAWLIKGQTQSRFVHIHFLRSIFPYIVKTTWKWLDEEIGYLWKSKNN